MDDLVPLAAVSNYMNCGVIKVDTELQNTKSIPSENGDQVTQLRSIVSVTSSCKEESEQMLNDNITFDLGSAAFVGPDNKAEEYNLKYYARNLTLYYNFGMVEMPHSGAQVEVSGSMVLLNTLGLTKKPDLLLKNIKKSEQECITIISDLNVADTFTLQKLCSSSMATMFMSMASIGVPISDSLPFQLFVITFAILDDIFDPMSIKNGGSMDNVNNLHSAIEHLVDFTRGNPHPHALSGNTFQKLEPFCKLLQKIREEALKVAKKNHLNCNHFIEAFVGLIRGCGWQKLNWLKSIDLNSNAALAEDENYFNFRVNTIGLLPCLEMAALLCNVSISDDVRNDPLLKLIVQKQALAASYENDIASFEKERLKGEDENILIVRDKHSTKETAQIHYCKTMDEMSNCYKWIKAMQQQLLNKYKNESQLEKYLLLGNSFLDANKRWQFTAPRYSHQQGCTINIEK